MFDRRQRVISQSSLLCGKTTDAPTRRPAPKEIVAVGYQGERMASLVGLEITTDTSRFVDPYQTDVTTD